MCPTDNVSRYTVSVVLAGLAMMPVGWQPWLFPLLYWVLMIYNYETLRKVEESIFVRGIDATAKLFKPEPFPPKLLATSVFGR